MAELRMGWKLIVPDDDGAERQAPRTLADATITTPAEAAAGMARLEVVGAREKHPEDWPWVRRVGVMQWSPAVCIVCGFASPAVGASDRAAVLSGIHNHAIVFAELEFRESPVLSVQVSKCGWGWGIAVAGNQGEYRWVIRDLLGSE